MTKIEALIDAAFHELQHDTGPADPEWVWQRNLLEKKFKSILGEKTARQESNESAPHRTTAVLRKGLKPKLPKR